MKSEPCYRSGCVELKAQWRFSAVLVFAFYFASKFSPPYTSYGIDPNFKLDARSTKTSAGAWRLGVSGKTEIQGEKQGRPFKGKRRVADHLAVFV